MISPKLTNCKECANIPDLLRKIDCKLAELGNNLYNNVVFMLHKPIANSEISQLLVYKRVLQHRFCDTHYAESCPTVSTEDIASKVIRLTAGCVPFCNEPTVCEITTCAIKPCPNPTTTTTSTSSSSTTTTTTLAPTTTTTTTLNCNFNGVIDCSITTTTTTTPPPTTTTTTTYFPDPFGVPCLWSTNGGDPGLVGVYDFDTNTATDVLVPNDFNETYGIERPICATEDKLWLASVVDQGSNLDNDSDDKVYIREWDIDGTTPNAPTLTYVREITVRTGQYSGANLGGSSVWAMTAKDNDTLILGTGNEYGAPAGTGGTGSFYGLEFSIAAAGDITVNNNDISSAWIASSATNTGKISNLTYTNSGQLILGYRIDLNPDGSGYTHIVGNYIKVFPTTPADPNFSINNIVIQTQRLQENGYPEFTNAYTGVKDAPFWGVNGLAQVLQPETLEVYTMAQVPQQVFPGGYQLSLTTDVSSSNDWLSSATHCSNIEFEIADFPNCGLTYFPALVVDDVYLGPQTFEYFGMTCTASLAENTQAFQYSGISNGGFLGCSGLVRPSSEGQVISRIVQGNNFSITIEFPVPVNNIPIRASVLNSNEDGTSGDVYYVDTNGGTPTLSINQGCFAQVDGNRLWGGVANPPIETAYNNEGDGEFKVTAPANYTSMTISGNAPTGGHLFLGCPPITDQLGRCGVLIEPKTNIRCDVPEYAGACNDTFRNWNTSGTNFTPIMHWNPDTGDTTVLDFPPNAHFAIDAMGIAMSENYIHAQIVGTTDQSGGNPNFRWNWTRYSYDVSPEGVPVNLVWEGIIYEVDLSTFPELGTLTAGMEAISDDKIVVIGKEGTTTSCSSHPQPYKTVFELTYPGSGNQMTGELIMRIGGNNVDNGTSICGTLQGFALIFDVDGNPEKLIYADYGRIESANSIGQAVVQVAYNNNPNGDAEAISFSQDFGIEYHFNSPKGLAYYVDSNGNEKIFVGGQFNVQQYEASNPGQALPPGLIPPPFDFQGEDRWFGWIAEVDINPPYTWTGVNDNVMPQYNGWAAQENNTATGTFAVYGLTTLNECSNGATGMIPATTTTTTTQPGQTTTTTTTVVSGVRTIFTKFNLFNQSV